jgi:hypothetical protein
MTETVIALATMSMRTRLIDSPSECCGLTSGFSRGGPIIAPAAVGCKPC